MVIMTLVSTPMGVPVAWKNIFFVRYWLIKYSLELSL